MENPPWWARDFKLAEQFLMFSQFLDKHPVGKPALKHPNVQFWGSHGTCFFIEFKLLLQHSSVPSGMLVFTAVSVDIWAVCHTNTSVKRSSFFSFTQCVMTARLIGRKEKHCVIYWTGLCAWLRSCSSSQFWALFLSFNKSQERKPLLQFIQCHLVCVYFLAFQKRKKIVISCLNYNPYRIAQTSIVFCTLKLIMHNPMGYCLSTLPRNP